jgi:hypothetical protein
MLLTLLLSIPLNAGTISIEQGRRLPGTQFVSNDIIKIFQSASPAENNWAGYVATTDTSNPFTDVYGNWTVPDITGSAKSSMADIWVGIGGAKDVGGGNIIQVGTELKRDAAGNYQYQFWYENYPGPIVYKGPVTPGHSIRAATWQVDATNVWHVFLEDDTSGTTIINEDVNTAPPAYPPNQQSAEWIVESHFPTYNLPNFGSANFKQCTASRKGGASLPINTYNNKKWDIEHNGQIRTTTGPLGADGESFTTTYLIPYDVTIKAYCMNLGVDLSVSITMDGSPTGFTTPYTFTTLTLTHTFTVPNADVHGHPFDHWSTGSRDPTITVSAGGTYTAYYVKPPPVGGISVLISVPVDKTALLASYIGLASTILVATVATAVYVNRVKRRKEKQ